MISSLSQTFHPKFGAVSGKVVEAQLNGKAVQGFDLVDALENVGPTGLKAKIGLDGSAIVTGETKKHESIRLMIEGASGMGYFTSTLEGGKKLQDIMRVYRQKYRAVGSGLRLFLEIWWAGKANKQVFSDAPVYHPGPNLFTNPLNSRNPFTVIDGVPSLTEEQPTVNPGTYRPHVGDIPFKIVIDKQGCLKNIEILENKVGKADELAEVIPLPTSAKRRSV